MNIADHLQCAVPSDWMGDFSQCLFEWQSLEGACIALIAAFLSIKWIKRQINQDKAHHADEISRRHNATRLTLPLALASIHELTQQSANEIAARLETYFEKKRKKDDGDWVDDAFSAIPFPRIALSTDILTAFKDFVETLRNLNDIRHIAELVASLQIFISRYNEYDPTHAAGELTLYSLMLDAAKIQLLTDTIYNYARFVDDEPFGIVSTDGFDKSWDEINGKALSLIFFRQRPDEFFPAFRDSIDRYKASGASPWNEKFAA